MDLATKLFTLSFGVEPNKATLKDFSDILNSAVLSLSDKQKALSDYAETAQPATYTSSPTSQPAAAPALPPRRAKPQVRWQITEEKMKELLWKRAQLLQFERARVAREKAGAGKVGKGRAPPPKLGKSKKALEKSARDKAEAEKKKKAADAKPPQPKPKPTSTIPAAKAPDAAKAKPALKLKTPNSQGGLPEKDSAGGKVGGKGGKVGGDGGKLANGVKGR